MVLDPGLKVGPYEILALIGAGGMGEVYRARDTRLKRDVALKVLPESFAANAERMARFQREAEVLASLNHTNIAQIYGIEERALVMELVEGESPKGPLPFEEAWNIATQIADALAYAHEYGIIHRDLKPANVKVTPGGVVKLLDFGLAKAFSPDRVEIQSESRKTQSPTLTLSATASQMILGTAAYMAPEQAKGKRVDKRADIWSWGVVLYELLTGERLFEGEDIAETLAAVIHKDADLEKAPANVRRLLRECLQKDPKLRLRDIGDAIRLVDESAPPVIGASPPRRAWYIATAVLFLLCTILGFITWKHAGEERPQLTRLFFPLPNETFEPGRPGSTAVSPDGRRVAFQGVVNGKSTLWVRDLDKLDAQIIVADGASGMPFWAPDSRRLGFFAEGKLKKIDMTGGPAVNITDAAGVTGGRGPWSGSWNKDDVIVFGRITSRLFRVSAGGGSPVPLTDLDRSRSEFAHFAPWFLPDGHHFLYSALSNDADKRALYVADLASKVRKAVSSESTRTIYVRPGYLLFSRDRTLMAQRFDAGRLETVGEALAVADNVDINNAGVGISVGYFSASQNGVLAYTSGRALVGVQLTWFDRTGKKLGIAGAPADLQAFCLSPDETRVAFTRRDLQMGRYDVWIRDLARGGEWRLTTGGMSGFPVWSPDGTRLYYAGRDGRIYLKPADNTGVQENVDAGPKQPSDVSRDGRYLISTGVDENGRRRIWVMPLFGDHKPFPYIDTEFDVAGARISPDGLWLAYSSNESKRDEIYVVSFPQPGRKWLISNNGGQAPVWSRNGRELFYYSADGKVMAVEVRRGAEVQFGAPKALFEARLSTYSTSLEVNREGQFLLPLLIEQEASKPMTVVMNWPELLNRK